MELDYIKKGDCLELMQEIPSGSVDMILCDLPYGTIKGLSLNTWEKSDTEWDNRLDTASLFTQYERVLRANGVAVLFSQEPYTSELRTYKQSNLSFNYPLIWEKDNFANPLAANKAPVSYFEDLSVFSKRYDKEGLNPLRDYFLKVAEYAGIKGSAEVNKRLGHQRADHTFRFSSSQFALCTRETYCELVKTFKLESMQGFKTYDELLASNLSFKKTFNLLGGEKYKSNILKVPKESKSYHPTQKPINLLKNLIETYTDEGDVVLDNCAGSGSTLVACKIAKRHYIGFELTDKYYEIALKRLKAEERAGEQISLY